MHQALPATKQRALKELAKVMVNLSDDRELHQALSKFVKDFTEDTKAVKS
jgi:hypothetical protein